MLLLGLILLAACFSGSAGAAFVKWRFEVDGQYILQPPAVAPDGSVAVVGSSGTLYSLTPAGALRWSVPSVGGEGGPSIGPDGTVYVGTGNHVTAVAPDGTIRWTYVEPTSGQGVIAGPTVGPDGKIYVVSDVGGLGAYALTPEGELAWSNPGRSRLLRVRAAWGRDRLRRGKALRRVRRGSALLRHERAVRARARWNAGLGGSRADLERHLHAAPGAARRRARREPVPDGLEHARRLAAHTLRLGYGLAWSGGSPGRLRMECQRRASGRMGRSTFRGALATWTRSILPATAAGRSSTPRSSTCRR